MRSPTASSSIRFRKPDSSSTRPLAPKQFGCFGEGLSFGLGASIADPVELPGVFPFPFPDVDDDCPSVLEPLLPVLLLVSELPDVVHL